MGSLLRFWVQGWVQRLAGASFPWGTFAVNVIGGFAIGFLATAFAARAVDPALRFGVLAGVLGGFTTFSTYLWETDALLRDGRWVAAGANIAGSTVAGLAACFAGVALARFLTQGGRA